MSRKVQEQPNIPPYSISMISNSPDNLSAASFVGIFDEKKTKDEQAEYRIKVKRPYDHAGKSQLLNSKKTITNQRIVLNADQEASHYENQPLISPELIPLTPSNTGYDICKKSFSEQQILQAFKVLDINKDEVITQQDIMFFLQYIKEQFTQQQVREMIEMVSGDGKKVTLQQFKKLGKGSIIPFADIKVPDQGLQQKKTIFSNIQHNPTLYEQPPSTLIHAVKNDIVSEKKFEQSKKSTKLLDKQFTDLDDDEDQLQFLSENIPLLDEEEFQKRMDLFRAMEIVNATEVVKNYHRLVPDSAKDDRTFFDSKTIAKLLQINQTQAKSLYQGEDSILAKRVVLQAIAYSPLNKTKRLEMSMMVFMKKKTLNFDQLYFLLQILKGKDVSNSWRKKLLTVFKSKNITKDQQIAKLYALQLLNTYSYNFNF